VVLAGKEERVGVGALPLPWELHYLHALVALVGARDVQPSSLEVRHSIRAHFIPVAVTLPHI